MQVFVEVARQQGFAPAARKLELSTSSVSRHVDNLEKRLRRQLFRRTTRHLALTQAGMDLLVRCERIVDESQNLFQSVSRETMAPSGRLKLTMPQFLATLLAESFISRYIQLHPEVELDLVVLTRVVNLVEEDFDLAIRVGDLPDSTLKARKLMDMKLVMVASPDYLDRHGRPESPGDLVHHNCIVETESPYVDRWPLMGARGKRHYRVSGTSRVNNGEIARDLVSGGAGLALLPIYMVLNQLENGSLVRIMHDQTLDFGGVYAVYPNTRFPSFNVHSFIELLIKHLRDLRV
jgi:DNA-binding transcriptional LysR family regulator